MSSTTGSQRRQAVRQTRKSEKKVRKRPFLFRLIGGIGSVILVTLLSFLLLFAVTGTICAIAATNYIINYMDEAAPVSIQELTLSYSTHIYEPNKDGGYDEVYTVQNELQRIPVELSQLKQYTKDAFVCAEDERFYEHEGVDYKRTAASFANMILKFWSSDQGGSTITQQLVKNLTGDDDLSPQRKIREIARAMQMERDYTKDEILETYINYIGFGGAANGVEMAARKYFGKHVEDLTIAESACLAAIPQSPELNNPFAGKYQRDYNEVTHTYYYTDKFDNTGREVNRARMEYILRQMYENGAITFDEYQKALNEHLVFTDTDEYLMLHPELQKVEEDGTITLDDGVDDTPNTWVIDEALNEFANMMIEERGISRSRALDRINYGGYQIYTTVNQEMQAYIEEKYSSMDNLLKGMTTAKATTYFRDLDGDGVYADEENLTLQSGFTAIDYQGRVLCTVGGIGEKVGSLGTSFASNEPQQPGSAIKPVTSYGYALEHNYISWGTHVLDTPPLKVPDPKHPGQEKPWPTNYSDTNDNVVFTNQKLNIYYALQKSYNTIPALLVKTYGRQNIFDFATKTLGLELNEGYDVDYAPLAVGALGYGVTVKNLVNAYMVYGSGGKYAKAHIIDKILTTDGQVYYSGEKLEQRIEPSTAYVMNRLLQNVVQNGTGTAAQMYANGKQIPIAGKTGTTSDWFDLMFVGLNPDFVSGVWIGYKENKEIKNHFSIKSAMVWKNAIGDWIVQNYEGNDYPDCEDIVTGNVCMQTGKIAGVNCPKGEFGYWKADNAPFCDNHELNLGIGMDALYGDT